MIRLYAVSVLPLREEACFKSCYLRSAKERREKADALKMPEDKARCIAAGFLLEYAYEKFRIEKTKELANANSFGYVNELHGFEENMPEVVETVRGKPEFAWPKDCERKCFFNLSHSGNYVICAMADFEVGADVQRRTRVKENVLRRFFSGEERIYMEAFGDDEVQRERVFAQIWARKEAQTKLTGIGIGQLMRDKLHLSENSTAADEDKYRIWQGMLEEDYAWAVAGYPELTAGEPEGLEPMMVDGGELFYEGKF